MPISAKDFQPPNQAANANLAGVQGVPPEAAGSAISSGRTTGVDPGVMMYNPALGVAQAKQQDNQRIVANNPDVAAFVGKSPVHAAVAQDSLPQLDAISRFITNTKQLLLGAGTGLASMFENPNPAEVLYGSQYETPSVGEVAGTLAPPQSKTEKAFRFAGQFIPGALFGPEADAGALAQLGVRGGNVLFPLAGATAAGQGVKALGADEQTQAAAEALGGLAGGFWAGIRTYQHQGPQQGIGRPPLAADGNHPVNPNGFVVDREGTPYVFQDPVQAAIWGKRNLKQTGQKFSTVTDPETGQSGIKAQSFEDTLRNVTPEETETAPEQEPLQGEEKGLDETIAEEKHEEVATLEDLIKEAPMHSRSPEAMQEFLEQHPEIQGVTAYIDPEALLEAHTSSGFSDEALIRLTKGLPIHQYLTDNQPVPVSLSEYLAAVAGKPYAEKLRAATSFGEPGQSLTEAKAQASAPKPPVIVAPEISKLSSWEQVAFKPGGSQPGAVYHDEEKRGWLVKGSKEPNDDRAKNEVLASRLMALAKIPHPEMKLIDLGEAHGGGLGVASRMEYLEEANARNEDHRMQAHNQFAVHAWLGNRDVIGTGTEIGGSDNSAWLVDTRTGQGSFFHFDPGGALRYRAQGKPKTDFNSDVKEWEGLRDPKINPHASAWFGDMTPGELQAAAEKLLSISDDAIAREVMASGVKDPEELVQTLIDRKYDILQKAGLDEPLIEGTKEPTVVKSLAAKIDSAVATLVKDRALDQLFVSPKAAGVPKARYERWANAIEEAKERIINRMIQVMRTQRRKEFQEAFSRHLLAVTNESMDLPIMKAQYSLRFTQKQEFKELTENNAFAPGGKPITFYHSSAAIDIGATSEELKAMGMSPEKLNPKFVPKRYGVISFSTSPEFINSWARSNHHNTIYIVHLKASSIGDFRIKADVDKAAEWWFYDSRFHGSLAGLKKALELGDYSLWEDIEMQKALGWQGSYMMESSTRPEPPHVNANVQDGSQVYFKYRLPQDAIKLKIATSQKALYPVGKLPQNIFAKDGLTADQVAAQFGLSSGQELMEQTARIEAERGDKSFRKWHSDSLRDEATRRTIDEIGNIIDPDRIMEEARAEFDGSLIERLLISQLKELRELSGQPFNEGDIQADALDKFNQLSVKEAMNIKGFEAGMKKSGEAVEDGLLKNQPIKAFRAKQAQLINYYQLREAHNFTRFFNTGFSQLQTLSKSSIFGKMDPVVAALITQRLQDLHMYTGVNPDVLNRTLIHQGNPTMEDLVQQLQDAGVPVDFVPVPDSFRGINEPVINRSQFTRAITAEEFQNQMDFIRALAKAGVEAGKISLGEEQQELAALVQEVQANSDFIGGGKTPQELGTIRRNFWNKFQSQIKSVLVENLRPEVPLRWMDRDTAGPLSRFGVGNLMNGKFTEVDLTKAWHDALTNFSGAKEVHNSMHRGLTMPRFMVWQSAEGPVNWIETRGQNILGVLNLGTSARRAKLFQGYEIPPEQWDAAERWMLEQLTPNEKSFIQIVWNEFDKLFDKADKNMVEVRGYGIKKDPPRPVGDMTGGYWPLKYKEEFKELAQKTNPAARKGQPKVMVNASNPVSNLPSDSYQKDLTGYNAPIDLDYMKIANIAGEIIHDIAYRKPLIEAQKILLHPDVIYEMKKIMGPEYARQILPWLNYIAKEQVYYDPATADGSQWMQTIASNAAYAHIAWEFFSPVKHGTVALSHITTTLKGDVKGFANSIGELVGSRPDAVDKRRWVKETFGEVRAIKTTWDVTLRDVLGRNPYGLNAISNAKEAGLYFFTQQKVLEAYVIALTKYKQEMAEHGDHETAVLNTNKAIRDTLGAGSVVDAPANFREATDAGNRFAAMFTKFMGFKNTGLNRMWTAANQAILAARKAGEGDWDTSGDFAGKALAGLIGFVIFASALLALFETFPQNRGDKRKSTGDRLVDNFGWAIADNTIGSAAYLNTLVDTLHGFSSSGMINELLEQGVKDYQHPEKDKALLAHSLQVAGAPLSIPDNFGWQAQNIYDALHPERLEEEDKTPEAWAAKLALGRHPEYVRPRSHGSARRGKR